MTGFRQSWAVTIGIDKYINGLPVLRSAVNDARLIGAALGDLHGYNVMPLLNEEATCAGLNKLLDETLPAQVGPDDRVIVYFAGHGIPLEGDDNSGPTGYILPQDAQRDDPSGATYLAMGKLCAKLAALPCRHLLLILDCCFAGTIRWSASRGGAYPYKKLFEPRYQRFLNYPAWQVLTSAAHDQQASDVMLGLGQRDGETNSPFAIGLYQALITPDADTATPHDWVVTATELYLYLRNRLEVNSSVNERVQTPGLWPLPRHDAGEYVFLVPGHKPDFPATPEIALANNPYKGLSAYETEDADEYFGREPLILDLIEKVSRLKPGLSSAFTVVIGPSGTGKSSLVRAGLIPRLTPPRWQVVGPIRPTSAPLTALASALAEYPGALLTHRVNAWHASNPTSSLLLVVDQLEELFTECQDRDSRSAFLQQLEEAILANGDVLHVVVTLRSDFEPQFAEYDPALSTLWTDKDRFVVTPMTQDELRQVIIRPASARALFFEPEDLVDKLINEVILTPGALTLLSVTLSELYVKYYEHVLNGDPLGQNRALNEADYTELKGVVGSLTSRAEQEYTRWEDGDYRETMERVLLRMVSLSSGQLSRRRVARSELVYASPNETRRAGEIIERLTSPEVRLVVGDNPGAQADTERYVEPAHDQLILGWPRIRALIDEDPGALLLRQELAPVAKQWQEGTKAEQQGLLWSNNPRLPELAAAPKTGGPWKSFLALWRPPEEGEVAWLNATEVAFVRASRQQRVVNRRVRFFAAAALVLLTLFSVAAAWIALGQRDSAVIAANAQATAEVVAVNQANQRATAEVVAVNQANQRATAEVAAVNEAQARATAQTNAEQQSQIALAGQLAAQGELVTTLDPGNLQLSLLLAVESLRRHPSVQADRVIRQGLALWPRPGLDISNGAYADYLIFTPDNKYLISSSSDLHPYISGDGLARVWDIATGKQTASFYSFGEILTSADSRYAVNVLSSTVQIWDLSNNKLLSQVEDPDGVIADVKLSTDNKYLVTTSNTVARSRVWDTASGQQLVMLDGGIAAAISPDSRYIVVAGRNKVSVYDPHAQFAEVANLGNLAARRLSFSPDGRFLVTRGSKLQVWDATDWRAAADLTMENGTSNWVFSPNSKYLAAGNQEGEVVIWDVENNWRQIQSLFQPAVLNTAALNAVGGLDTATTYPAAIIALSFNADGSELATGRGTLAQSGAITGQRYVQVWDTASGQEVSRATGDYPIQYTTYSPDGHTLATIDDSGDIRLWDTQDKWVQASVIAPGSFTKKFAFSPDDSAVLTVDADQSISLWDIASAKMIKTISHFEPYENYVNEVEFSPSGRLAALAGSDGVVHVLESTTGREVHTLKTTFSVSSVVFSPDEKYLALFGDSGVNAADQALVGPYDNLIEYWQLNPAQKVADLLFGDQPDPTGPTPTPADPILNPYFPTIPFHAAISWDDKYLVAVTGDVSAEVYNSYAAEIWDALSGRLLGKLPEQVASWPKEGHLRSLDLTIRMIGSSPLLSPNQNLLATIVSPQQSREGEGLKIWQLPDGKLVSFIKSTSGAGVTDAVFSPDGKMLALTNGGLAQIVSTSDNWKTLLTLDHGGNIPINKLEFGPASDYIATHGYDDTIRVWQLPSGEELARVNAPDFNAPLVFSHTGRYVAVGADQELSGPQTAHQVSVWAWQAQDLIAAACERLTRNMTSGEWTQYLRDSSYSDSCPAVPAEDGAQPTPTADLASATMTPTATRATAATTAAPPTAIATKLLPTATATAAARQNTPTTIAAVQPTARATVSVGGITRQPPATISSGNYTYRAIDPPGAVGPVSVYDVNSAGLAVGSYQIVRDEDLGPGFSGDFRHGFVMSADGLTFSDVLPPDGRNAIATSVNDSGEIVGTYRTNDKWSAFFLAADHKTYAALDTAEHTFEQASSLNNYGQMLATDGQGSSFLITSDGATVITIPAPDSGVTFYAAAMSDQGDFSGTCAAGSDDARLCILTNDARRISYLDLSSAQFGYAPSLQGLNDSGQVVGFYSDSESRTHGFVIAPDHKSFIVVDYPEATDTIVRGINNAGVIFGSYRDQDGTEHGFIANPRQPDQPISGTPIMSTPTPLPTSAHPPSPTPTVFIDAGPVRAGDYSFLTVEPPNSVGFARVTGVNTAGNAVGSYYFTGASEGADYSRGFVMAADGTTFTDLLPPGGSNSDAIGITADGQIVGTYDDSANNWHPYVLAADGKSYTRLAVPGFTFGRAFGVNDSGQVLTECIEGDYQYLPCIAAIDGSSASIISLPAPSSVSMVTAINNSGQMIGSCTDGSPYHWPCLVADEGRKFSYLKLDPALRPQAGGINDAGQIVGGYWDNTQPHGFILDADGTSLTTIDYPAAMSTNLQGINNEGVIYGSYLDWGGNEHGFIARPLQDAAIVAAPAAPTATAPGEQP